MSKKKQSLVICWYSDDFFSFVLISFSIIDFRITYWWGEKTAKYGIIPFLAPCKTGAPSLLAAFPRPTTPLQQHPVSATPITRHDGEFLTSPGGRFTPITDRVRFINRQHNTQFTPVESFLFFVHGRVILYNYHEISAACTRPRFRISFHCVCVKWRPNHTVRIQHAVHELIYFVYMYRWYNR